ncbi:hypothetical protein EVAR_47929_1 [Eumeta japonica]|uniref:Uncharacterized protein n=1 Tax=Eumeta variegata TaxID=151549 RepID=A0A4C1Y3S9_EUMVA|nr:hypothetical protein EVAR_47929_1 [Eumeta japonica]
MFPAALELGPVRSALYAHASLQVKQATAPSAKHSDVYTYPANSPENQSGEMLDRTAGLVCGDDGEGCRQRLRPAQKLGAVVV